MSCCDVTVTARCDDGTTRLVHARGPKWGKIIDCDTCLDEAYFAAAHACGGEDHVVSRDAQVDITEGQDCADMS
jgi:hypothetical protein